MQKTVDLLRGFARVSVECPYPERFLNLCASEGVAFWGAERTGALRLETAIASKDLARAEGLAKKLGGELKPLTKHGAVFFLERFRRRYALIAGLVVCAAALLISNMYIWEFSVEGNEEIASEEILQALREIGVTAGMRGGAVDIETARNQMLLKNSGLAWITVNVTGSHATVVVRERLKKPEIYQRDTPVNVIAEKAGLILQIDTLSGSAQVFPGDTVRQGQLLVSGLVDSAQLGVRLVNARADVTARTWTELTAAVPTGAIGKRYTGREKTRYALVLGNSRVNLYGNSSQPYAMYDKMSETSVLRISQNLVFPVAAVRETYTEYEPTSYQMDEAVAEAALRQALEETLRGSVPRGEILSERFVFRAQAGLASASLTAESEERIDVSRRIDIAEALGGYGGT
jgi:similar to stage IV sporulation protein